MTQSEVAHDAICTNETQPSALEDADVFLRRVDHWMRMGRDLSRISRSFFDKADTHGLGHIPAESIESRIVENLQVMSKKIPYCLVWPLPPRCRCLRR